MLAFFRYIYVPISAKTVTYNSLSS